MTTKEDSDIDTKLDANMDAAGEPSDSTAKPSEQADSKPTSFEVGENTSLTIKISGHDFRKKPEINRANHVKPRWNRGCKVFSRWGSCPGSAICQRMHGRSWLGEEGFLGAGIALGFGDYVDEEPKNAVLVSGYGEMVDNKGRLVDDIHGPKKIITHFHELKPLRYEGSSSFPPAERQRIMDRYSVPSEFVRVVLPSPEAQRAAILAFNRARMTHCPRTKARKRVLLVQRYFHARKERQEMAETAWTRADDFHVSKQEDEERTNKSTRDMGIIRLESKIAGEIKAGEDAHAEQEKAKVAAQEAVNGQQLPIGLGG